MYSCHLFLIFSASVRPIPFLSCIVPIFAWNVPLVSNFLEEISSLSHSIFFLFLERCYIKLKLLSESHYSIKQYVQMWELDHKEGWAPKYWCFWIVMLEKTPESPLDNKKIKPVNPKGNQSWIFTGRTDAEAETPIFRPPNAESWLFRKDLGAGKDWGQRRRGQKRMR